jgi:hypothetical protein
MYIPGVPPPPAAAAARAAAWSQLQQQVRVDEVLWAAAAAAAGRERPGVAVPRTNSGRQHDAIMVGRQDAIMLLAAAMG